MFQGRGAPKKLEKSQNPLEVQVFFSFCRFSGGGELIRPCIQQNSTKFVLEKIINIETVISKGFVTPITTSGTLLPEGILASCFASAGGENGEMSLIDEVLKYRVFTYLTVVMPLQIRDFFVDIEGIDRQNESNEVCDPMECDKLIKNMWNLGSYFRKIVADVSGIFKNFKSLRINSEL